MKSEDFLMNSQNIRSIKMAEKTEAVTKPSRGADAVPGEETEELVLDDLLAYQPVPPRRVTRISVQYHLQGRGRPLPYSLNEAGQE
jgi:hypothetical protein